MQATAQYIEELSDQLSHLATRHELHDLAYLLRLAADEARASAELAANKAKPPVYEVFGKHG